jgi:hypothetical protein
VVLLHPVLLLIALLLLLLLLLVPRSLALELLLLRMMVMLRLEVQRQRLVHRQVAEPWASSLRFTAVGRPEDLRGPKCILLLVGVILAVANCQTIQALHDYQIHHMSSTPPRFQSLPRGACSNPP